MYGLNNLCESRINGTAGYANILKRVKTSFQKTILNSEML